jgi:hypothetical protein
MEGIAFREGTIFQDPDTLDAYILVNDVYVGDAISYSDFKGLNKTPDPKPGDDIPDWLGAMIWPRW